MNKFIIAFLIILISANLSAADRSCISGNCKNGAGTMIYSNGNLFIGEFKNGKRHGNGVMLFNDGSKFEGKWINDQISYIDVDEKPINKKFLKTKKRVYKKITKKVDKSEEKPEKNDIVPLTGKLKIAYDNTMLKYYKNLELEYLDAMDHREWKSKISKVIFVIAFVIFLSGLFLSGFFFYLSIKNMGFFQFSNEYDPLKDKRNNSDFSVGSNLLFNATVLLIATLAFFYFYLAYVFV